MTPTDIETKKPLENEISRGSLDGQIFSLKRLPHVFGTDGEALKSDFAIVVDARYSVRINTEACQPSPVEVLWSQGNVVDEHDLVGATDCPRVVQAIVQLRSDLRDVRCTVRKNGLVEGVWN